MRKRVTATCEAVTRKAHVIAFVERIAEGGEIIVSCLLRLLSAQRNGKRGRDGFDGRLVDRRSCEESLGDAARTNVEVWGEARRKVSVLAMDGLREPAEALKKNITQGAAQGGGSDALAISNHCGRGFRLNKNRIGLKARS
jgi:hypothetical protein